MSLTTPSFIAIGNKFLTDPPIPGFDGPERTAALNEWGKLLRDAQDAAVAEQAILADRNTSDAGKTAKLVALGSGVLTSVSRLSKRIDQATAARAELEQVLFAPLTTRPKDDTMDPMEQFLREQELRRLLPPDSAGRIQAFLIAVESDDLETVRSILTAPGPAWIPADVIARAKNGYGRRTNPEAWQRLQGTIRLQEQLRMAADAVSKWLMHFGVDEKTLTTTLKLAA